MGGVFGTVDAAQMKTDSKTNIVNNGFVTGNGFTGGIVGNLFTTGANTSTPSLTGLRNNGTVSAGANYKGDTAGDARSLVLGQFFGGIAGYGRGVTLQGCESVTRSDLTETQLKEQVKAGFDETGTLTDASPLKGDFVGGLSATARILCWRTARPARATCSATGLWAVWPVALPAAA